MPEKPTIKTDLQTDLQMVARGFLMGGADIIPGVSGGTVALIVGIYERLVWAISHFDLHLLGRLKRREFRQACEHIDLRFLVTLGLGIGSGIASLASLMHYLLEYQRQHTMAVFFGLILASSLIVSRLVPRKTPLHGALLIAGIIVAYLVVGLPMFSNPPEGNWYYFLCGVIAICAMILPGISGSFILLILGKYHDITGHLRNMLHGEATLSHLESLAFFGMGAVAGLLAFSKVLRWLLERGESFVMAILCGLMLGSLRKIWPFQEDLTPEIAKFKLKTFHYILPDFSAGETWLSLGLAMVAFLAVLALDHFQQRLATTTAANNND